MIPIAVVKFFAVLLIVAGLLGLILFGSEMLCRMILKVVSSRSSSSVASWSSLVSGYWSRAWGKP
jgi:hypothetical protein